MINANGFGKKYAALVLILSLLFIELFCCVYYEHKKIQERKKIYEHKKITSFLLNPTQKIVKTLLGYPIVVDPRDGVVAKNIMYYGIWEPHVSNILLKLVKEKDTVVEVGSNYGYHTILLSNLVGNKGKVYGYEANIDVCSKILNKNIVINDVTNNVKIKCIAVSDKKQQNVKFLTGYLNLGGSFIVGEYSNLNQINDFLLKNELQVKTVNTIYLDQDLHDLKNVDILRMDAEGAELAIINGADRLINSSKNIKIITEWDVGMLSNFGDVKMLLEKLESKFFNFYLINDDGTLTKKNKEQMLVLPHCDVVITRNKLL